MFQIGETVTTPQPDGDKSPLDNELTTFRFTSAYSKEALLKKIMENEFNFEFENQYYEQTLKILKIIHYYEELKPLGIWAEDLTYDRQIDAPKLKPSTSKMDFVNKKLNQIILRQLQVWIYIYIYIECRCNNGWNLQRPHIGDV